MASTRIALARSNEFVMKIEIPEIKRLTEAKKCHCTGSIFREIFETLNTSGLTKKYQQKITHWWKT